MSTISVDLQQLYQRQFGVKPVVTGEVVYQEEEPFVINGSKLEYSSSGSSLTADYLGRTIWLPIKFFELDVNVFGVSELLLPYATIKMTLKKNMIETPMAERQGTVKELFSIADHDITIKGFIVGKDASGIYPQWPEKELILLKKLFDLNEAVKLDNALTNVFTDSEYKVVIKELDLVEVEGGKKNIRPFSFKISTDTIFTLELE